MTDPKQPDPHTEGRREAIARLASLLYEAELLGFDPEALMQDARQRHQQLREEAIERDLWDEHDREY